MRAVDRASRGGGRGRESRVVRDPALRPRGARARRGADRRRALHRASREPEPASDAASFSRHGDARRERHPRAAKGRARAVTPSGFRGTRRAGERPRLEGGARPLRGRTRLATPRRNRRDPGARGRDRLRPRRGCVARPLWRGPRVERGSAGACVFRDGLRSDRSRARCGAVFDLDRARVRLVRNGDARLSPRFDRRPPAQQRVLRAPRGEAADSGVQLRQPEVRRPRSRGHDGLTGVPRRRDESRGPRKR